jgi:hypothetical protein
MGPQQEEEKMQHKFLLNPEVTSVQKNAWSRALMLAFVSVNVCRSSVLKPLDMIYSANKE